MKKLRVLVIAGGPSPEHPVSLNSGKMVFANLDRQKYIPFWCTISRNGMWSLGRGRPLSLGRAIERLQTSNIDVAFLALHGAFGEDGQIQAILESLRIPFTGSGAASSAVAMDKQLTNQIAASAGLTVPPFTVVRQRDPIRWRALPAVVKPVSAGSSFGAAIVRKPRDLRPAVARAFRYDRRVMIQRFISGKEITCGVLERRGKPYALPPTEIIPKVSSFFDYRAKYLKGGSDEITPARISRSLTKIAKRLAVTAHDTLGCRGLSRSDFILRGTTFFYLETNTIPGLTAASLFPKQARAAGLDFPAMLDFLLTSAV